jgi:hypothetical protein
LVLRTRALHRRFHPTGSEYRTTWHPAFFRKLFPACSLSDAPSIGTTRSELQFPLRPIREPRPDRQLRPHRLNNLDACEPASEFPPKTLLIARPVRGISPLGELARLSRPSVGRSTLGFVVCRLQQADSGWAGHEKSLGRVPEACLGPLGFDGSISRRRPRRLRRRPWSPRPTRWRG